MALGAGGDLLVALRVEAESLARARRELLGWQPKGRYSGQHAPSLQQCAAYSHLQADLPTLESAELPRFAPNETAGEDASPFLSETMVKFAPIVGSNGAQPIAAVYKPRRSNQPQGQALGKDELQADTLEAEVEFLRRRCAVLDHCLAHGERSDSSKKEDSQSESSEDFPSQSSISKEIERYASEVRQLRAERQHMNCKLQTAYTCESQCSREHVELLQRVESLQRGKDELESERSNLVAALAKVSAQRHAAEDRERDAKNQIDVLQAAMRIAEVHSHGLEEATASQVAQAKQAVSEREQRVRDVFRLADPLHRAVAAFQRDYKSKLEEYGDFISEMKQLAISAKEDLDQVRHTMSEQSTGIDIVKDELNQVRETCLRSEKMELEETLVLRRRCEEAKVQCKDKLQRLKEAKERQKDVDSKLAALMPLLHERQKRQQARQQRLEQRPCAVLLETALRKNISREMIKAQQGLYLDKITRGKKNKREVRFVFMDPVQHQLKWGLNPNNINTSLDLHEIIHLDYGSHTVRPCIICKDVSPWLCFSLYTLHRSYDFICKDEDEVRCFVLAISRSAPRASGAVRTRGQFEARKGWCKLEDRCIREHKTLIQLTLEAIWNCAPPGSLSPRLLANATTQAQKAYPPFSNATPCRTRLSETGSVSPSFGAVGTHSSLNSTLQSEVGGASPSPRRLSGAWSLAASANSVKQNLKAVGSKLWK